ncbi:hypothetical protein RHECNPAF_1340089 [Rhizobium etli CNPAF512]|nr:hypothetical protein RHECNPAF_1340089 [Rhizobium etli CNPAF512]
MKPFASPATNCAPHTATAASASPRTNR